MFINLEEFKKKAFGCWFSLEEVPDELKQIIVEYRKAPDVLTPLSKGKQWLFEGLLENQPETGKLLLEAGELFIGCSRPIRPPRKPGESPKAILGLFLEVDGKVVQVGRSRGYGADNRSFSNLLPTDLKRAYYSDDRMEGLVLMDSYIPPLAGRILPIPSNSGWPIIDHCSEWFKTRSHYIEAISNKLSLSMNGDGNHYGLRAFVVNSYNGLTANGESDILLIDELSKKIIYVKDGDFGDMRFLDSYLVALDKYCNHSISNLSGRFDFQPFLGPKVL